MVNGWLFIDKPLGVTSNSVVTRVRRRLPKGTKVGHAGTLDPLATGVLPLALGEATKLIPYLMDAHKAYQFTVQFGAATATDDVEGEVVERSTVQVTEEQVQRILPDFMGLITQVPPAYSAIKIGGERAYALARQGQEVVLKSREIEVFTLKLLGFDALYQQASFLVECSKGTYVRSLGRDIARKLGSCGHIIALRRTKVGVFLENQTIPLAKWEEMVHNDLANFGVAALTSVLDDIPVLCVSPKQAIALRHGQSIPVEYGQTAAPVIQVLCDNLLVALGPIEQGIFFPKRVFAVQNDA